MATNDRFPDFTLYSIWTGLLAAYRLHRNMRGKGDVRQLRKKLLENAREACEYIARAVEATLEKLVDFRKLDLICGFKPLRNYWQKDSLASIKQGAENSISNLRALLNGEYLEENAVRETTNFLRSIRNAFSFAGTSKTIFGRGYGADRLVA